jgi:hypothetical protein
MSSDMAAPYETVTVPRIEGWISQKKANVPAVVNVWENDAPWLSVPESHDPSDPVHVWAATSSLVAVTRAPGAMRVTAGENAKSSMVIRAACAVTTVVVGAAVVEAAVVGAAGAGAVWAAAGRAVVAGAAARVVVAAAPAGAANE